MSEELREIGGFETERLIIREADMGDIEDLYEILNDEVVLKYNCLDPMNREKIAKWIEYGTFVHCIELKSEGKIIGTIGCEEDSLRYGVESRCIDYLLNTNYVGHGYMTEALREFMQRCFDELGLDMISARAFSENERSIRLLERLGFTLEGKLRYAVRASSGIVYDDCLFSIKRDEIK